MKKRIAALFLAVMMILSTGAALADYYRINTNWLKGHEKPSYSAKVLDSYRRDFAVSIAKRYGKGWAKVRVRPSGATIFVQEKYLVRCKSYTAYIKSDKTPVMTGPARSFKVMGKLKKGTKVTVLTHGSAFDFCKTPRGKGYIRNTHLTRTKPKKKR